MIVGHAGYDTAELQTPLNTAGMVGDSVTLSCRRPGQKIAWTFVPAFSASSVTIVSGCEVVPGAGGRYRVATMYDACHLVIDKLSSAHAGAYTCQYLGSSEKPAEAQLVVLSKCNT